MITKREKELRAEMQRIADSMPDLGVHVDTLLSHYLASAIQVKVGDDFYIEHLEGFVRYLRREQEKQTRKEAQR